MTSTGATTSVLTEAGASGGSWVQLNSDAVGDFVEFTTGSVTAGTYSVKLAFKANTTRGQLALTVDGAAVGGTVDQYAGAIGWPAASTIGTVTFGTTGTHKLRLTVSGKNAASTGYLLSADRFDLVAQGAVSASFEAESLAVTSTGATTSVLNETAASGGSWVQLNSDTVGDFMEFTTGSVTAGSYSVQLAYKANSTRGQLALTVDGAAVGGTVDQYASAIGWPAASTIGTVTFSTTGTHKLRLTVTGKNAASTGFLLSADKFNLVVQTTPPPAAPTGLTATAASTSQINLTWTASSGATSYNVKRATVSGGAYTTVATGVTTTSNSDTGLASGTTYFYVVSAVSANGESANSTQASATTLAVPAAPTGLTATAASTSQINLTWVASSGATSYNVKRATVNGGPYTTVSTGLSATSFSNSGLNSSTTYYYVVSAVNGVGESANSAQSSATTLTVAPAAPTGLSATAISSTQINLAWTASASATGYNVKRATATGGPYTTIATGQSATTYSNTGLASSTTYYYVVSAVNGGGESPDSAEDNATTLAVVGFPAGAPVSTYILGQNDWQNVPDSAWGTIIKDGGVTMVRIGGISRDTTPPANSWLLQQVDQMRAAGFEPVIQVSRSSSASTAAATVQYLNITNNRNVKYWSIGNEPDNNWTGTEADLAATIATYTKDRSVAMRDVDPSIFIMGPECAWYTDGKYGPLLGGASDITGRDSKGRFYVDHITVHRYPFSSTNMTRTAVLTEMHSTFESKIAALTAKIAAANQLHSRTGASALSWGLTEFNMNYGFVADNTTGLGNPSYLNGQFFAEYYRVGMKYGAQLMNTWSLLEGGNLGFFGGSWSAPVKRSSYYHMQMVSDYLVPGGYLAATSSKANMGVLSTSSTNQAMLSVMILNEDTVDHTFSLRLDTGTVQGTGDTKINVAANLAAEYTSSITQQTTVVLVFDAQGVLKQKITYSLTDNTNNVGPHVVTF